jgi:hypothetical protein
MIELEDWIERTPGGWLIVPCYLCYLVAAFLLDHFSGQSVQPYMPRHP